MYTMTRKNGESMYYVPDGTKMCGYFECRSCDARFLDIKTPPRMVCPYCGEEPDMEIGPDEPMPEIREDAELKKVLYDEDVERYDILLSVAITGGDSDDWI